MVYIYSERQEIDVENEIGRIESVKHVEWLLIIFFLYFAFNREQIKIIDFLFYITGAQFPDILEFILFKLNVNPEKRRIFTHNILIPIIFVLLTIHAIPFIFFFFLSYFGHLFIDLFSGGDPIYFLMVKGQIINKEKRLNVGTIVFNKIGYLWEDSGQNPTDLSWFWILQFFGSVFGAIAFCIYLIMVPNPL